MVEIVSIFVSILWVVPFAMIFRRMGRSGWWSLIGFIPLGFLVLPWMAALMRWERGASPDLISDVFR